MRAVSSSSMSLAASRLVRSQVALGDPASRATGRSSPTRAAPSRATRTGRASGPSSGRRPSAPAHRRPGRRQRPRVHGRWRTRALPARAPGAPRCALGWRGREADVAAARRRRVRALARRPPAAPDRAGARAALRRRTDSPGAKPPLARVLRRVDWRLDGSGILDRHAHLWVAPARPGGRPRRILSGDLSAAGAVWSPDGARVAYVERSRRRCRPAPAHAGVFTLARRRHRRAGRGRLARRRVPHAGLVARRHAHRVPRHRRAGRAVRRTRVGVGRHRRAAACRAISRLTCTSRSRRAMART